MTQTHDTTFNGVPLYADEKAEPLDDKHYIIQSEKGYRFGTDAVKLAQFAAKRVKREDKVFDLCSGCGIIGISIAVERGCIVDGVELERSLWDMSVRSCALNRLDGVRFVNADARDISTLFPPAAYDCVVCNPPFYKRNSIPGSIAPNADSEITVTFAEVVGAAKHLLRVGGDFCIVHTSSRLDEVLSECRNCGLAPKQLALNPNGKTFLLRAVRGGKSGMTVCIGW